MLLSQPLTIRNMTLRNRIVMPPMATGKSDNGKPTEQLIEYYRERARATGLIIVEHEYVSPEGMAGRGQLSMASDDVIPAYRKLTDAVHAEGCSILAQISHAGFQARDTMLPSLAPSAVKLDKLPTPQEMSQEDIHRVTAAFAAAAVRAIEAGFDGIDVHAAHGYLLNQFYTPAFNHRTDEYSVETIENRTRFHCAVLQAIREAAGESFTVAIRFGGCDYMEGGSRPEDIPQTVRNFVSAGADIIDVTGGMNGFMIPGRKEPGWFSELSVLVKEAVNVPVILTGGVTTGEQAEDLLQKGTADLIGVGRAMMRQADWSETALRG